MNTTKRIFMVLAIAITVTAAAQDKKPASPAAKATGTINGANITINYSSPYVKGRAIWGELVPYGKVWRAGANAPTTFETDKALKVEGQDLPAGKYALYVIPEKDDATIIFGKDPSVGANRYDQAKDQLRVKVKTRKSAEINESLVYKINNDNVTLSWEYLDISVRIK
ncbi:hypothetical protein CHU92_05740 [Flavobacterium cyanobacteriorum]|uniref:DUF2911 domain-containing protein n=1 Tax=Flavobacterium cyanobacteriorum TaxID=2022802 RepID=A0A255ZA07_9FLAO|nr:DUF2911 domain-containing protein [Flavobacterium cyanobacteriorum]OYQ38289.1 hypothetical protein CHU92_05740 [Flavobacterium cyanobacteriorum]